MIANECVGLRLESGGLQRYNIADKIALYGGILYTARNRDELMGRMGQERFENCFLLPAVSEVRETVKDCRARKKFWVHNLGNFGRNIKNIVDHSHQPEGWKIYALAGTFESDEEIMPHDHSSWSGAFIVSATEKQGFELMYFMNTTRAGFLSAPALLPLAAHELAHGWQAARFPLDYCRSVVVNEIGVNFEREAEKGIIILPDELRREAVLESILYCFDRGGFESAAKMADFFHVKLPNSNGGGYNEDMTSEEYGIFQRAMKHGDIGEFIGLF